jgi:hypothetical protein
MILAPYVETSAFIQPILTITDDLAKLAVYEDKVDRAGALFGEFVDDYGANVVQQSIGGITTSPSMLKFIERSFDPQSYVNIPPEYDNEWVQSADIMSGTKIVYKDFADRDMFDGQELTLSEALDKLVADDEFKRLPSKSENFNGKQDVLENIYKQITDRAVNELVRGEGGADLATRIANK